MLQLIEKIKENLVFSLLFVLVVAGGVYATIYKPLLPEVMILEKTFWLFGLALQATILLIWIGSYLLKRWFSGGKKNATQLIWAASFLIYSLVFIGMAFQALKFPIADASKPMIFFAYRQAMIVWLAGMYWGLSRIIFKDKALFQLPLAIGILAVGYGIFAEGLLIKGDIEYTMYRFLHFLFIPMCLLLGILFWKYSRFTYADFAKYLSIGFFGVAGVYVAWAPWHRTNFYSVWFFLFNMCLVPILVGFILAGNKDRQA